MKMIPTTGAAPINQFQAYVHNCKRNVACEPAFAAPLPGVPYLQLYVDFGQYQPLTFEIQLQDMCDTGHSEQIFPSNYIVGQTPEGNWYGVFKYFNDVVTPVTNFVAWLSSLVDAPTGLTEKTFFSELLTIDPCDNLMKVKSCQPEGATITGFDVNDVYYGLPANVDFLGLAGVRYFHIAYVRRAKVRELSNKATFKSSLIRNFRTTIEKTWQLESEIVPQWYKDVLLAIFARGAIQIDDTTTYLVSDLNFEALNDDDLRWKPFAQLKATFRLYFGCDSSECVECCSPTVTVTSVVSTGHDEQGSESGGGGSTPSLVCPLHIQILTQSLGFNDTNCDNVKYWVRLVDDLGNPVANPLGGNILVNSTADYIVGDCATPSSSFSTTGNLTIPPGDSESSNFFAATASNNIVNNFTVNSVSPTEAGGCDILLP